MSKKVTSQVRPHVEPPTRTQLVTPSLPWKRGSPSTIHLPNDSISLIGARASTSDGRPTEQSPKAEAHPFFETGFGSERGRPTDTRDERDDREESRQRASQKFKPRERGSVRGRARNKSRRRVGGIHPTNHRAYITQPLSASVSFFSLIPPQAETFICLRTA